MRYLLTTLLGVLFASQLQAEIQTKDIEYYDGELVLEGFAAWDTENMVHKAPGISWSINGWA